MDGYRALKPALAFALPMNNSAPTNAIRAWGGGTGNVHGGEQTYMFDNSKNNSLAIVGYGASSTAAISNCTPLVSGAAPVSGVILIARTTVQPFTLQRGIFLAGMLESGAGSLNIISGDGV